MQGLCLRALGRDCVPREYEQARTQGRREKFVIILSSPSDPSAFPNAIYSAEMPHAKNGWESPGALTAGQALVQNAAIASNLDNDGLSWAIRIFGMNADKFNPFIHSAVSRSKIKYHDPVLVVLYEGTERSHHLDATFAGQIAAEDRIVDSLSETIGL